MQTIQLPDDIYQRLRSAAEAEYREPAGQIAYLVDHYCKPVPQELQQQKRRPPTISDKESMLYRVLYAAADLQTAGNKITAESLRKLVDAGRTKSGRCRVETTLGNLVSNGFLLRSGPAGSSTYKVTDSGFIAIGVKNEKPQQLQLHR